jgi:hypothetical protein
MNLKQIIIENISNNTKLQLKPSKVCGGVGLFTITEIKKGEKIFDDVTADDIYIKWNEIPNLKDEIKFYLNTMCNSDNEGVYLSRTPNNINLSYFVNHSNNPNIIHDLEKDSFTALRDIGLDEEIVCVYYKYEMVNF